MKRTWLAILLIILAAAILFLPVILASFTPQSDKAWARVEQTGVIRFAINPAYMPFDSLGHLGDFFGTVLISPQSNCNSS